MIRSRTLAAWSAVSALALVAVLARVPQLVSPNLLAEGDECIVGLMGLHVARLHDFPLFMYGQSYGLAIVEAPAAAVSFALFGAGAVTLKLAILAVWIAGAAFYFRVFSRVLGTARGFWIALVLVLMPAWAVTSMKAWSGYVTAFAATAVAIDLIVRNEERRAAPWLGAGLATATIYFAQALWLPGLLPIVLYHLVESRRLRCWTAYMCGTLASFAAVEALKISWPVYSVDVWFRPSMGNPHLLASLPMLVRQFYVCLTGSFYFGAAVAAGRVTTALAVFWFALFCAVLLLQVYRLATRRYLLWSHLLAASIVLTLLANWMLLEHRDARYVMAVNAPLAFLAGVELFDLTDRFRIPWRRTVTAILLVVVVQAVAMREFAGYSYMWWTTPPSGPSETKTLRKLIGYMEARGVTRAYAMNLLLPWTITFYSNEAIIARSKGGRDRYQPYIVAADRALEAGRPVAIVGYAGYTNGLEKLVPDPSAIVDIDGKYFVYIAPDRELLTRAGFHLVR
jgi:hypothetical protein